MHALTVAVSWCTDWHRVLRDALIEEAASKATSSPRSPRKREANACNADRPEVTVVGTNIQEQLRKNHFGPAPGWMGGFFF